MNNKYDDLIKRLREEASEWCSTCCYICGDNVCGAPDDRKNDCDIASKLQAADAIEKLSAKVDSLQLYVDNISKLPDCNTCLKNSMCEFRPKLGEYCRINCPAWLGHPKI